MGRIEEALRKAKVGREAGLNRPSKGESALRYGRPSVDDGQNGTFDDANIHSSHIVHINENMLQEQRVIAASEHDDRVGHYRQLRTQLLKTMRDNQWTTLSITSAHEGAGKSLTASNLAISMARDVNTSVLLVDLDLNTPTIHQKLNLKPEKGLVDFLQDRAKFEDIVFSPGIDSLTVLAGRSAGQESSELLDSPNMQKLIRDIYRQHFADIVIFDLPPLLRNDDALLFAPYTDAVLLVVEDGVTTEEQLRHAIRLLEKSNLVGTILNKVKD